MKTFRKKKKRNKDKDREKLGQTLAITDEAEEKHSAAATSKRSNKTKAELAYERSKEKRQTEQILEKARTSHKERIMHLNRHLDTLTEHFDIPKVSWTK
ncbi:protein FAM32A-like isoform X2 [Gigantopelta aegis]|uniref:protein FAM32A-like isoform X2 n=1 Tax=Gigantopelta aegis TaxID=1735272 RepID=UPI001B88ABF9|nr:protein FAM32A-like isoform X2 [Gigantopelta aegis]